MKWYKAGALRFEKQGDRYVSGDYEIVRVYGYYFAFYFDYLLNRDRFSKAAAYRACLEHAMLKPWERVE